MEAGHIFTTHHPDSPYFQTYVPSLFTPKYTLVPLSFHCTFLDKLESCGLNPPFSSFYPPASKKLNMLERNIRSHFKVIIAELKWVPRSRQLFYAPSLFSNFQHLLTLSL